jgi:hypothetical protein
VAGLKIEARLRRFGNCRKDDRQGRAAQGARGRRNGDPPSTGHPMSAHSCDAEVSSAKKSLGDWVVRL